MKTFSVTREHCPIDPSTGWFPVGAPLDVQAEDAVWAALHTFRQLHLQPGRDRVVIGSRIFHPGTVN